MFAILIPTILLAWTVALTGGMSLGTSGVSIIYQMITAAAAVQIGYAIGTALVAAMIAARRARRRSAFQRPEALPTSTVGGR